MPRQTYIVNLTLQFDNPIQPPQYGAPVMLTSASIVTNAGGTALYQPAYTTVPASPEDVTDEMLAAIASRLAALGLSVARLPEADGQA